MPTTPTPRRRTINCPEARSRQIATCAAYLNISGDEFIQSAITAAILSLCENDRNFSYLIARATGVEWNTLEFAARQEALANMMIVTKS